jgi:hypothetical protein
MEYPKINSLWKRSLEDHFFIEGDYSCPEFGAMDRWRVEEKIDGTNIRIYFQRSETGLCLSTLPAVCSIHYNFDIKGRTANSDLPRGLEDWIYSRNLEVGLANLGLTQGILYGEGFGAGIQRGGIYRPDKAFMLFDCYTTRWSTRDEVHGIAEALGLETPHDLGLMTEKEIIKLIKSSPKGFYGDRKYVMEGIIARSEPLVRFNNQRAEPVVWKLKVGDFK